MTRKTPVDPPFSINLPPDVRQQLNREAVKRGGMPIGVLIRMIIADWFDLKKRRDRNKKLLMGKQEDGTTA